MYDLKIVSFAALNGILLGIAASTFAVSGFSVIFVVLIALAITAFLFYKRFLKVISAKSHNPKWMNEGLTTILLLALSFLTTLQLLLTKFSLPAWLGVALLGGVEIYALREFIRA